MMDGQYHFDRQLMSIWKHKYFNPDVDSGYGLLRQFSTSPIPALAALSAEF
jgi:hypothetical protein